MAFGMPPAKKSPMVDKGTLRKVPPTGEDFDPKKQVAGKTTPNLPDRDGPAKVEADPKPQKPKTHEPAKKSAKPDAKTIAAMKSNLSGVGKYSR